MLSGFDAFEGEDAKRSQGNELPEAAGGKDEGSLVLVAGGPLGLQLGDPRLSGTTAHSIPPNSVYNSVSRPLTPHSTETFVLLRKRVRAR